MLRFISLLLLCAMLSISGVLLIVKAVSRRRQERRIDCWLETWQGIVGLVFLCMNLVWFMLLPLYAPMQFHVLKDKNTVQYMTVDGVTEKIPMNYHDLTLVDNNGNVYRYLVSETVYCKKYEGKKSFYESYWLYDDVIKKIPVGEEDEKGDWNLQ